MFKRRHKPKLTETLRNFLWPKIGWARWAQYYSHRVGRLTDSPYSLAAGLACGVAVSFTPFIGFHVILAVVMAFIIRGNMFASAIGTIIGTPWTFPFIWTLTYNVGAKFTELEEAPNLIDLIDGKQLLYHPLEALEPVFFPMLQGGLIVGFIVGWACYFVFYYLIVSYRKNRQAKLMRSEKRFADEQLDRSGVSDKGGDDDS